VIFLFGGVGGFFFCLVFVFVFSVLQSSTPQSLRAFFLSSLPFSPSGALSFQKMALIPPGGDHWIECEWRLHYPESPCPYSAAFTGTYQAVLGELISFGLGYHYTCLESGGDEEKTLEMEGAMAQIS